MYRYFVQINRTSSGYDERTNYLGNYRLLTRRENCTVKHLTRSFETLTKTVNQLVKGRGKMDQNYAKIDQGSTP